MAGSSLLALIDDIATILDDVSVMTKVATKKTAGVLGDDLALNAQQVTGVHADRELPVVWAVAKGSFVNKAILVPSALAISALVPAAVTPLLMCGGAFLCFEGAEKLVHRFLHPPEEAEKEHTARLQAIADPAVDLVALERDKIKGAIRTDFILSAEIIVIALGTVKEQPLGMQLAVLVAVALVMNVGVYGLVAAIVRIDNVGQALFERQNAAQRNLGRLMLLGAPLLMKTLSVLGTLAMFLVGGDIIAHGFHAVEDGMHHLAHSVAGVPVVGHILEVLVALALHGSFGLAVGLVIVALFTVGRKLTGRSAAH